jgi:ParB/RepB/Spo0J family partition protein
MRTTGTPGHTMMIALEAIDIDEGQNPREHFPEKVQRELVESIRNDGVLTPVLVRPEGERYVIVAGHRRIAAAREAGLSEIPALVREAGIVAALMENVARAALSPVEEARALVRIQKEEGQSTQAALAARLGVSEGWVRTRLRLAELPEMCRVAIGEGQVPLAAVDNLHRISQASPALSAACIELVLPEKKIAGDEGEVAGDPGDDAIEGDPHEDEWESPYGSGLRPQDLVSGPGRVVRMVGRFTWDEPVIAASVGHGLPIGELIGSFPDLMERAEALGLRWASLSEADEDAARAYGCLLEFPGGAFSQAERFICDREFLADLVRLRLDAMASQEESQSSADSAVRLSADQEKDPLALVAPPAGITREAYRDALGRVLDGRSLEEVTDEERAEIFAAAGRVARAERVEAQGEALRANEALGRRLAEHFHRPDLTLPAARLIGHVIGRYLEQAGPDGMRLTAWHSVEAKSLKSGEVRTRTSYPSRSEAKDRLREWLCAPTDANEVLGRTLQALLALAFSDQEAIVRSERGHDAGFSPFPKAARTELAALSEGHLPDRLREIAHERMARSARFSDEDPGDVAHGVGDGGHEEPDASAPEQREDDRDRIAAYAEAHEEVVERFPRIAFSGAADADQVAVCDLTDAQAAWLWSQMAS